MTATAIGWLAWGLWPGEIDRGSLGIGRRVLPFRQDSFRAGYAL